VSFSSAHFFLVDGWASSTCVRFICCHRKHKHQRR